MEGGGIESPLHYSGDRELIEGSLCLAELLILIIQQVGHSESYTLMLAE